MYKVVYTKQFNDCLRKLNTAGKKGKDSIVKARAAQSEACASGEITIIPRTKHGESRLPNIEKFELGDGHRLVVQLVDGVKKTRAFLFAGDHEDAEAWLESHKDYKWVRKDSDGTMEFVQYTVKEGYKSRPPAFDLESPQSILDLPLLRGVNEDLLAKLNLEPNLLEYAKGLTGSDWERDQEGIMDHLAASLSGEVASLVFDVFDHAHKKEFNKIGFRIELFSGNAKEAVQEAAAEAMLDPVNCDKFITWTDSEDFFNSHPDADWADWMLFLHPEQKNVAVKDFNGPARLRGVSGSGKTCVIIHRARLLAKKYGSKILVLTLTESTRKLIDSLLDELCGVERGLIETFTVSAFAREIISQVHPRGDRWFTISSQEIVGDAFQSGYTLIRNDPEFQKSKLSEFDGDELRSFLRDEVNYIRSRFTPDKYEDYSSKEFKRVGRSIGLPEQTRRLILKGVKKVEQELAVFHRLDHDAIIHSAIELLSSGDSRTPWRSILVDEVQDLSQMEMELLSKVISPSGEKISEIENGLFLVGDGAQTIYKKGFSLKSLGINISGRSYAFKKNYRNTFEILNAAYGLISTYTYADVDEDNLQKPLDPDFASRHGEKPFLVKCASLDDESNFIAWKVSELISEQKVNPGQICIISANQTSRTKVMSLLSKRGINIIELRQDVYFDSSNLKISTIESAKGHEFTCVFVMGLIEGVIPLPGEEISREASRLYVAMTRACFELYLSYSSSEYVRPSSLLPSIQKYCNEYSYSGQRLVLMED